MCDPDPERSRTNLAPVMLCHPSKQRVITSQFFLTSNCRSSSRTASKRPQRSTNQTTAYTQPEREPEAQGHSGAIPLSDGSSDEYPALCQEDETEPRSELDIERLNIAGGPSSGRRRESQVSKRRANNHLRSVRISTTSGSQEVALVWSTPASRVRIPATGLFTPLMFP